MLPPSSRNLASAASRNADPVYMTTGRFAPPNQHAVWHLPTAAGNVLQIIAREHDGSITLLILTTIEGGY